MRSEIKKTGSEVFNFIKIFILSLILTSTLEVDAQQTVPAPASDPSNTKQAEQEPAIIDGRITDEEFGEPLEKAIVEIMGSGFYTVTNRFGYFKMKVPPAFFQLQSIHPGIFSEFYNVSTYEGILTPQGAIRLEPMATGRLLQRDIAARVNPAQHPAATRNTPVLDMLTQSGGTDFNELFIGQPSVYLQENGGGYGSSQIRIRGFSANQNQLVFNGISLNDPETGQINSALYPGLNDWANQVQFTSGITSGKQSELGQTGLINILPFMPNKKFGVNVLASTGVNGYLKTAATVHSGLNPNKLAFSLKIDRTSGDGIPDYTGFESYGVYFNLFKEYNHVHSFLLTSVLKSWQSNLRTRPDSVSQIATFGINHNNDHGFMNDTETGWNGSFGVASLSVLTHHWHLRVHARIISQLYAQFENSVLTFPQGAINGLSPYQLPSTDRGLIDFDAISAYNSGKTISESDGIAILDAVCRSTRLGLQSQYIHELNKESTVSLSADFESYSADHFGAVNQLLGADRFVSTADLNGNEDPVENFVETSFLPKTGKADKADHNFRSLIRKGGLAMKLKRTGNKAFSYAETGLYIKSLKREDFFSYVASDSHQSTDWINQFGWRLNGGITYRLNELHSLRLNSGLSGSPAHFDILFPAGNNWENISAKHQNLYASELAYVLNTARIFASLRGYIMYQQNRTEIQRLMLNDNEKFAVLTGLNQLHRGIELSGQITYFKRYNFYVSASYGKWTFKKSANAKIYDEDNLLLTQSKLPLSNYKTDNCPPVSVYARNEFNLLKGLEININYYRSLARYAPMLVHDFDNTETPAQVKLPAFDKLGLGLNYYHELKKNRSINVFADMQNLTGSQYINQLYTNQSEPDSFRSNLALYGKGMSWRLGLSFSF